METLRWDSCDSREAPPHRINSSVIARDQDPTLTSVHRPTQTGRPLQLQVFFGVWDPSLCSLTHLGSPGRVVTEITATPWPPTSGKSLDFSFAPASGQEPNPPQCERTAIITKKHQFVPRQVTGCVYGLPYCCFISVLFFILVLVEPTCFPRLHVIICKLLLTTCFAHIPRSDHLDGIHD